MILQHNLTSMMTARQLGITTDNLKKSTERLSSGYRVNRAADNAAALAMSEKKRSQVRGLLRALKNADDGVNMIKTADGAMSETGGILNRMRELAIQSLNDAVLEPDDQAKLQMEFDQLQSEIDRINDQTEFNKKPVFDHYAETHSVFHGNRVWPQDQPHVIDSTNNSLVITYQLEEGGGRQRQRPSRSRRELTRRRS